jgi:hypothetical protein
MFLKRGHELNPAQKRHLIDNLTPENASVLMGHVSNKKFPMAETIELVSAHPYAYNYLPDEMKGNKCVVMKALEAEASSNGEKGHVDRTKIPEKLMNDPKFLVAAVDYRHDFYRYVPHNIKSDPKLGIELAKAALNSAAFHSVHKSKTVYERAEKSISAILKQIPTSLKKDHLHEMIPDKMLKDARVFAMLPDEVRNDYKTMRAFADMTVYGERKPRTLEDALESAKNKLNEKANNDKMTIKEMSDKNIKEYAANWMKDQPEW